MKRFFILGFIVQTAFCFLSPVVSAQVRSAPPVDIRSRLVELAIQNPNMETADHQINIAEYNLKANKRWWLQNIGLSFNFNEFTIKRLTKAKDSQGNFYPFYPIYNLGFSVPIGMVFTQPSRVKASAEQVAITKDAKNSLYIKIKTDVLTAYEDYLAQKELLTLQNQSTENAYNNFLQAKEKFRNGEIQIAEYNIASEVYNTQLKNKINAQHTLNITVIQLEGMIGTSLSTVLNN